MTKIQKTDQTPNSDAPAAPAAMTNQEFRQRAQRLEHSISEARRGRAVDFVGGVELASLQELADDLPYLESAARDSLLQDIERFVAALIQASLRWTAKVAGTPAITNRPGGSALFQAWLRQLYGRVGAAVEASHAAR